MAAEPVGLNPALRPWYRAGVEFLLAAEALPAPCSLCIASPIATGGRIGAGIDARAAAPTHGSAPHGFAHGTSPGRPAASPVASAGSPRTGAASTQGSGAARPANSPQDNSAHAATGTVQIRQASQFTGPSAATSADDPSQLRHSVQAQSYLPPDKWPAIWQQRLQKTAPAAVLWTYWALGEDMCVRPDPARRTLLQKMLADLGHPAGTHSFWPAALPHSLDADPAQNPALSPADPLSTASKPTDSGETLLYPAPEIFWSGVQLLKARAVVVMGSPALKALELPARLRPFQQTRHRGTLVVVLRDVDFLAQELTRYDAVKAFLRQALAPFGR